MNAIAKPSTNVAPLRGGALTPAQLDLVKRTVAKDTTPAEFDHFMHTASHLGLDPLRKQILCVVFNKNDEKKRNMTIIVPQDGLRVVAARQRDYGPSRDEPEIDYDPALKSDVNPLGIVRAKVTLWKRYADGWQPVVGVAYWDEFAAIDDEVEWRENDNGKRYPHKTGKQKLADNWRRMGRVMIAKCATCQALRAGWPDDFAGVYGEEEIQRAVIIDAASDAVADFQEQQRIAKVNPKESTLFVFAPTAPLEAVPRGEIADRVLAFIRAAQSAQELIDFRDRNAESLRTFWAWAPGDALEVKKALEQRIAELAAKHRPPPNEGAGYPQHPPADASSSPASEPAPSSLSDAEVKKLQKAIVDMIGEAATLAEVKALPAMFAERLARAPQDVRDRAAQRFAEARMKFGAPE